MRFFFNDAATTEIYTPTREVLLFDRHNDPYEIENLAATPEGRAVVPDLFARLVHAVNETEPRMPRHFSGC